MGISIPPSVVGTALLYTDWNNFVITLAPTDTMVTSYRLKPIYGQIKNVYIDLVCFKRKNTAVALNNMGDCNIEVSINEGAYQIANDLNLRLETPLSSTIYSEETILGTFDLINDLGLDPSIENRLDMKIVDAVSIGNNLEIFFYYRIRTSNVQLTINPL